MAVDTELAEVEAASTYYKRRAPFWGTYDRSAWLSLGVALAGVALTLGPILYLFINGFRTHDDLTRDPTGFPNPWMWQNYLGILWDPPSGKQGDTAYFLFWRQMANSLIVGLGTTLGVVILGTMAAYPLARYRFKGREALFGVFTTGLMFPLTVAVLPLYLLLRDLHISGLVGLMLPQIAFALPTTVIIMRPFLKALPDELEEAAFMDGISRIGFFWRMVIPLARPGMVTVGVLAFVGSWNAYLLPLLLLGTEPGGMTLPLGVTQFQGAHAAAFTLIMAYTALSMIPALIFFLFMEKRIVDGLTGAVKG